MSTSATQSQSRGAANQATKRRSHGAAKGGVKGQRGGATKGSRVARLIVRPAVRSDLEPLSFFFDTVLRNDYFLRRGQLEDMLAGKHHELLVAELDEVLVGLVIKTAGKRLVNVLVHPGYRGLGIGRQLIERSAATEVRCKLDMSTGDPRGFYTALGFEPTGERSAKGNVEVLRKPTVKARRAAAG